MGIQTVDPPSSALTPTRKAGETQRLQTVCIEMPIIVQGSRNSHPPQPFLEETRTVIVFPHGAVLRLTEVVTQGQIVIIQNMRLKQEVACRVTSSKPSASVKGYVEVEFTQPTPGFWGIGFPGEAITPRHEVVAPATPAAQLPYGPPTPAAPTAIPPTVARPSNGTPVVEKRMEPAAQIPPAPSVPVVASPVAPVRMEAPAAPVAPPAPVAVTPVVPAPAAQVPTAPPAQVPTAPAAQVSAAPSAQLPAASSTPVRKPTPEDTLALNRAIVASFVSQTTKAPAEAARKTEIVESIPAREEKSEVAVKPAEAVKEIPAPRAETPVAIAPPVAPAPVEAAPVPPPAQVPTAPAAQVPAAPAAPAATVRDSGKLSDAIRENVRENLSNKARDEAREDLRASSRVATTTKPSASPNAPISLAESLEPANATVPTIQMPAVRTETKVSKKKAAKEKQETDKKAAAFTEHSSVQVMDGQLFGQTAASSLSSGTKSNTLKIVAIAATVVLVLGGGAFGYRWYARNKAASAALIENKAPSAPVSAGPATQPPAAAVNSAGAPNTSTPGAGKNPANGQKQGSPAGITNGNPATTNAVKNTANGTPRLQSLPQTIVAPKAPSAGTNGGNNGTTPELNLQTPPPTAGNGQTITLGTMSAMPAPPPAPKPNSPIFSGSSAPNNYVPPKLIALVPAAYPKQALMRGDEGEVAVTAMVNEQGKVYNAKATSGPPTLRFAAVDAVSLYRYEPGKLDGKAVPSVINVVIKFNRGQR